MNIIKNLLLLFLGIIIGGIGLVYLYPQFSMMFQGDSEQVKEAFPLHWVAPMDPNYKRDKPGKSPMGMDLIPVYDTGTSNNELSIGTIEISPDVINNLGVRTHTVQKASLNQTVKTVGYVEYDEDKLIHVHPRVEGWVEKLYVKASGDPVKRGQALYTLYSPELVNAQEEYLIAIKRKNSRLIQAAESRLKALQLPRSAIANLKKTEKVKQTITFYAPQTGVITVLNIREGFYAQPGTLLMTIGKLDQVWVHAEIFERQSYYVKLGQAVTMTLAYVPGRQWVGKVDYIYPSLSADTRTLKVRLRFNNDDKVLMPNMFAQVVIHADDDSTSIVVPKEAVIRTGNSNRVVMAMGNGRFKSINVDLGRSDETNIEILNGINSGEKIVTSAQFLIDSESSKTSDFKRMDHGAYKNDSITVKATINSVDQQNSLISVSHQVIPAWNRPQMTMTFKSNNSVDLSSLEQGTVATLTISSKSTGELIIESITPEAYEEPPTQHKQEEQDIDSMPDISNELVKQPVGPEHD